jgi:TonB family protein
LSGVAHASLYIGKSHDPTANAGANESADSAGARGRTNPPIEAVQYFRKNTPPKPAGREKGSVIANITISESGAASCELEERSGSERIDAAVVKWCREKKFSPATRDGVAVPYSFRLEYGFRYGYNSKIISAAEKGNAKAQFNVGMMYESGQYDFAKSDKWAARWYRKSANQGQADAQNNLGLLYATGNGVEKNIILAYFWLSNSVNSGKNKNAQKNLAGVIAQMSPEQITRGEKLLRDCVPESVEACL